MYVVAGLLLPIWKRLPQRSTRVYRLCSDDGEQVVGRMADAAWVAATLDEKVPALTVEGAWPMLLNGTAVLHLAEGQQLSRTRQMGIHRIELTGFNDLTIDRLKTIGLISEIVSWKLRLFVPTGAAGVDVLARLIKRYPLVRVAERSPAKAA
jgi:hypothetical protein